MLIFLIQKRLALVALTKARDKAILTISDSVSSPKYYLYDMEKGQMKYLLTMWPEIDDAGLEEETHLILKIQMESSSMDITLVQKISRKSKLHL